MTDTTLAPISKGALAEHWFSLRNKTWRKVANAVKTVGVDQTKIASRIEMDAGQFSKVISGKKPNLTLRTLHNIARAVNHRLEITLVPLISLPKPNYSYESAKLNLTSEMDEEILNDWDGYIDAQTSREPVEIRA